MIHWLFSAITLVVLITIQAEEFIFGHDIVSLKKCIKDHLSNDLDLKIGKNAEIVAEMVSRKFHEKSLLKAQLSQMVNNLYNSIKYTKSYLLRDIKVPEQLRKSIRKALESCIDRKNIPVFDHNPAVLVDLLDYILVDWPTSLESMGSTRNGRSTLRLYAYSLGVRLMSALGYYSMNYDVFHRELRRIWMLRAPYFDNRGSRLSYIRHRFTTDRDRMYSSVPLGNIHTIDEITHFTNCNPTVELWELYQSWHTKKSEVSCQHFRYFIIKAEYYLEAHIDQCYRVLFFILELQLRGISTDEDDSYDGPIPLNVVPFFIQELIWKKEAYRNYLKVWREDLRKSPYIDSEGFFSNGTKEDLIMILTLSILKRKANATPLISTSIAPNTVTSTESTSTEYPGYEEWSKSTTNVTSITTSGTEFPGYEEGSKKGGTRLRNCGKYFSSNKRFRTILPKPEAKTSQKNNNFDCYGYILCNDDASKKNDASVFLNVLTELSLIYDEPLCYS